MKRLFYFPILVVGLLGSCAQDALVATSTSIEALEAQYGIDIQASEAQILAVHGSMEAFAQRLHTNQNNFVEYTWADLQEEVRFSDQKMAEFISALRQEGITNPRAVVAYLVDFRLESWEHHFFADLIARHELKEEDMLANITSVSILLSKEEENTR